MMHFDARKRGARGCGATAATTPGSRRQKHLFLRLLLWCFAQGLVPTNLCFFLYYVGSCGVRGVLSHGSNGENCAYEWEDYNHYQILGLEDAAYVSRQGKLDNSGNGAVHKGSAEGMIPSKDRNRQRQTISTSDVKKAYRKMAQKYHPDKIQGQLQQQQQEQGGNISTANTTKSTADENKVGMQRVIATKDEANARFSRISEAYQVLTNETERRRYDAELSNWEERHAWEEKKMQSMDRNNRGKYGSSRGRKWDDDDFWADVGYSSSNVNGGGGGFQFADPLTLFQQFFNFPAADNFYDNERNFFDEVIYDTYPSNDRYGEHGRPVHASEHTEIKYDPTIVGRQIYRITRQEMFSDGYYRVITQDSVMQNRYAGGRGSVKYMPITEATVIKEGYDHTSSRPQSNNKLKGNHPSYLSNDEYMIPGGVRLKSQNSRFEAYLNEHCELVVKKASCDSYYPIWSSDTFYPSGQCIAIVTGSQFSILAGSSPQYVRGVIWTSPVDDAKYHGDVVGPHYLSLDDDGSLVLYRRASRSDKQKRASSNPGRNSLNFNQNDDICVWASGNAGCMSSGRRILAVGSAIQRGIKRKIDGAFEFADTFSHPEDVDLLDTLVRVVGNTGKSLAHRSRDISLKTARLARIGIQLGRARTRTMIEEVSKTFQKRKGRNI